MIFIDDSKQPELENYLKRPILLLPLYYLFVTIISILLFDCLFNIVNTII